MLNSDYLPPKCKWCLQRHSETSIVISKQRKPIQVCSQCANILKEQVLKMQSKKG